MLEETLHFVWSRGSTDPRRRNGLGWSLGAGIRCPPAFPRDLRGGRTVLQRRPISFQPGGPLACSTPPYCALVPKRWVFLAQLSEQQQNLKKKCTWYHGAHAPRSRDVTWRQSSGHECSWLIFIFNFFLTWLLLLCTYFYCFLGRLILFYFILSYFFFLCASYNHSFVLSPVPFFFYFSILQCLILCFFDVFFFFFFLAILDCWKHLHWISWQFHMCHDCCFLCVFYFFNFFFHFRHSPVFVGFVWLFLSVFVGFLW